MAHIEINMQAFANNFETYIVGPLAEGISQRIGKIDNLTKDQRAQLCNILKYDIKAMTFNIATIIGVAYIALTLFGSIGPFYAAVGASTSFFIREVANESLAVTKSKSFEQLFSRMTNYFDRFCFDDKWQPDYLSWNNICILKNPTVSLGRQFNLVKQTIFAKI